MNSVILLLASLAGLVAARPQDALSPSYDGDEKNARGEVEFDLREDQSYDLRINTDNGIDREESGIVYPGVTEETGKSVISGSWQYTAPNGQLVSIEFIADENGYRPTGDVIPKPNNRVSIQDV